MAAKDILQRGFKSKAEKLSIGYREQLGLRAYAPMCAFKLAASMDISIYPATDFLNDAKEIQSLSATGAGGSGWSALTMKTVAGNTIIIHNPFHSSPRQQSDIMHELAHIICGHAFQENEYDFAIPMGMRSFNELHEEEAKCLGSALQISRPGLLWGLKKSMNHQQMGAHFNASTEMVAYRMQITGAARQHAYKPRTYS